MLRLRIELRVRLRPGLSLELRLGGGGSVPVATPDTVHSSELQLSLATTSYLHPS